MSFKYLVCIDFEATCWPGKYTRTTDAEIIEIGAVLLNVETGNMEDKFHCYVRPTKFPQLSSFCINLTGIPQSLIDRQDTFLGACNKFRHWIEQIQLEKDLHFANPTERVVTTENGLNATFCSWSNWDLEFYFKIECQRVSIDIEPHFKTWIDVRQMYDIVYGRGKCKFSDALKRANCSPVGDAHSAISDATNLSQLLTHLIKQGGIECTKTTNCCV